MAYTPVPVKILYPEFTQALLSNAYSLTNVANRIACVFQIPDTGTLDAISFYIISATTPADLRIRLETVNSSGQPSGSLLDANSSTTLASGSVSTGVKTVTFSTPFSVTRGTFAALTIDAIGAASVSVAIMRMTNPMTNNFPYGLQFASGSWTKQQINLCFATRIGSTYKPIPGVFPMQAASTVAIASNGNPDERGLRFSLPFDTKVRGGWICANSALAGTFELVLYDASNTVLATTTRNTGTTGAGTNGQNELLFGSDITCDKNTVYRLVVKPTTTTSVSLSQITLWTGFEDIYPGGSYFQETTRVDGGTWTDNSQTRLSMGLLLSEIPDSATGGGGATGRYKAKVGGTFVDIA